MEFARAFNPNYVLGQTANLNVVDRETLKAGDQQHDVRLTYACNNIGGNWLVEAKQKPTVIPASDLPYLLVDPQTCKPL